MTDLDTATAALALGVTQRTVQRMVATGALPNTGSPRAVRVPIQALIGHTQAPTPPPESTPPEPVA